MTAETLAGRLLCASTLSYGIRQDGELDLENNQQYYDGAAFQGTPVPFSAGFENDNACLVGQTSDGVVLAFRGTLAPEKGHTERALADWINDFDERPVKPHDDFPGHAHDGFWRALDELWTAHSANGSVLKDEVRSQLEQVGDGAKLYVTGHSKGGGISPLAAWRLTFECETEPTEVITYAAPRCATKEFAKAYNAKLGDRTTRYEFEDDVVPHLPPHSVLVNALEHIPGIGQFFEHHMDLNYREVGKLKFIHWNGDIVESSMTLGLKRLATLAERMVEGHFKKIATDHMSSVGFGYMRTLHPTLGEEKKDGE